MLEQDRITGFLAPHSTPCILLPEQVLHGGSLAPGDSLVWAVQVESLMSQHRASDFFKKLENWIKYRGQS